MLANMISKVSRPAPRAKRRADSRLCRCSVAGPSPGIHLASTSDGGSVEADTVPLGTTIPGSRRSSAQGEGGERAGREGEGAAWRSSSIAMIQLSDLLDHSVAYRASFTTFTSRVLHDALTSGLARLSRSLSPLISSCTSSRRPPVRSRDGCSTNLAYFADQRSGPNTPRSSSRRGWADGPLGLDSRQCLWLQGRGHQELYRIRYVLPCYCHHFSAGTWRKRARFVVEV